MWQVDLRETRHMGGSGQDWVKVLQYSPSARSQARTLKRLEMAWLQAFRAAAFAAALASWASW